MLETRRLLLRSWEEADGPEFARVTNTPEVLTEHPNGLPVLRERVTVSNPDDHRPDGAHILARWRQQATGCRKTSARP